ncbi:hypothetical protein [Bacillus sp. AK128]
MGKEVTNKKAVVLTDLQEYEKFLPSILNYNNEELIVINSFGSVTTHSYGCLMRSVLLAVYTENVNQIYIVADHENSLKDCKVDLLQKLDQSGVSRDVIQTLEYIDVVNHDLVEWLTGPENPKDTVQENIEMIKNHPLLPESIEVNGYLISKQSNEITVV